MSRRLHLALLCALVVVALGASAWRAFVVARGSMADQIRAAEALAASERAQGLAGAISAASDRLDDLIGQAASVDGLSEAQQLDIGMRVLMSESGSLGATITLMDGTVLASVGSAPVAPVGSDVEFRTVEGGHDATMVVRRDVTMPPATEPLAVVVQELSLAGLLPVFSQPFAEFQGATSLATTDGQLLMSSLGTTKPRVDVPAVLEALGSGRPSTATFRSDRLGTDRIAATHPVGVGDLVVIVGADVRSFSEPATALVRDLAAVLVATAVVVGVLVGAIAVILRKTRRHWRHAASLAVVDPLTGLTNRRGLDERIVSMGAAAVIAVDLDGLKIRNDTYGHAAGDEAIVAVAEALRAAVRTDDVVARVGGDEFVVVMPGADRARADRVVQAVREALTVESVSVSTGIAVAPPGSVRDALAHADDDLYVNKRARAAAITLV